MDERKPIFYDHKRLRWRRTRRALEIGGILFSIILVIFFLTVINRVDLPSLLLPTARTGLRPVEAVTPGKLAVPHRKNRRQRIDALGQTSPSAGAAVPSNDVPENYDPLRMAFYVSWDSSSLASLKQHFHDIDLLVPEQMHSITADGRLDTETDPKLDAWRQTLRIKLPMMPLLNNSDGTAWHTVEMAEMLRNPEARTHLVRQSVAFAVDGGHSGVVLDFEEVPHQSQRDFVKFIGELAAGLHGAGLKLMVALPAADWDYDYADIGRLSDAIILMNYDQHWLSSAPGPIAAQDWFVTNISTLLKLVPREKLIMGIANYAYDWPDAKGRAAHENAISQSFEEAVVTASESETSIEFDPDTLNPHYSYYDEHDHVHQVWMMDAITTYNELRAAERFGVRGTALWRMGQRGSLAVVDLGHHPSGRRFARTPGRLASRLRFHPRGRRGHLAHHRHAAKRAAHAALRRRHAKHRGREIRQPALQLSHRAGGRGA